MTTPKDISYLKRDANFEKDTSHDDGFNFTDASSAKKSTLTSNRYIITRKKFIQALTKCRLRAHSARSILTATKS